MQAAGLRCLRNWRDLAQPRRLLTLPWTRRRGLACPRHCQVWRCLLWTADGTRVGRQCCPRSVAAIPRRTVGTIPSPRTTDGVPGRPRESTPRHWHGPRPLLTIPRHRRRHQHLHRGHCHGCLRCCPWKSHNTPLGVCRWRHCPGCWHWRQGAFESKMENGGNGTGNRCDSHFLLLQAVTHQVRKK